ncbi:MAG: nitroreductase family protein [Bacteroidales bacterium]|nr:nitroreductase family protein [Bacteroidales bacterium]MDE7072738.1 nitroreductase family protein [Bacteroidales bacterium]
MKTSKILNVILAVAVIGLVVKVVFFSGCRPTQKNETLETGMAAINLIMSRTSIRAYSGQSVENDKVETLLKAAMAAPTAGNKQPWKFVVIKDKQILNRLASGNMKMAADADLAIVVCGDLNLTFPGEGVDYWIQDASAATENLLLAAHALGLGAVWCGIYPIQERVRMLSELLNLPEHIIPLNVIPIGYPAENPEPKDKWKPNSIHYDSWDYMEEQ